MDIYQKELSGINYNLFLQVVKQIKTAKITGRAPLGYSSNDIMLFGTETPRRRSVVSVRNHSGMYSMLITMQDGSFLFNGGFDMDLPYRKAATGLYCAFKLVKDKIA